MEFLFTLISCNKKFILFAIKEKMEDIHFVTSALRGFHYYRTFWKPIENQKLNCLNGDKNRYD